MARKLLHRSLLANMLVSAAILLVTVPIFYTITEALVIEETDEALVLRKKEFLHGTYPTFTASEIPKWNRYNRDVSILPDTASLQQDTIFVQVFHDSLEAENEPYRVLLAPITIEGRPYTFMARRNMIESEDFVESIGTLFLAVILVSLIGMYLVTKWMSHRLWKPFYTTLAAMEAFEIDQYQAVDFPATNIVEFDRLNLGLSRLLQKNRAVFALQREFVDNAAHELQTPLAIMQSQVDLIIQRPDLTQGQAEMLARLQAAITRLLRLNKNLLLLSKLESRPYEALQAVSIDEVLTQQLEFFTEQAQGRDISIQIDRLQEVTVTANPALVETAIANLFLNAIRHNIDSGFVHITLDNQRLQFRNSASKGPLPQTQLFQRFSKIDADAKGHGLGLSIVEKITRIYGWAVTYTFSDNSHVFTIHFSRQ